MSTKNSFSRVLSVIILMALIAGYGPSSLPGQSRVALAEQQTTGDASVISQATHGSPVFGELSQSTTLTNTLFIPIMNKQWPWYSPFGVESTTNFTEDGNVINRATSLGINWVRMNDRISWKELQPVEGQAIDWTKLADFEIQVRALKTAGLTPIVIVDDYPAWATYTRENGTSSNCGPLLEDKFGAFAEFMRQLAKRYKAPEFNVHVWELGNEPDVDADLFPSDSHFGCWGDDKDVNYGGAAYGRMLLTVTPVVRAADPLAKIWIGGLLLDNPHTQNNNVGKPEQFFRGILEAGKAAGVTDYFDMVPFHAYVTYQNQVVDHDNGFSTSPWFSSGGAILGKANYLNGIMAEYGISKPLFINEISMMCPDYAPWCTTPAESFYQAQANFAVRTMVRGLMAKVTGYTWYSLEGPGWRYTGLWKQGGTPTPAFVALQQLNKQIKNSKIIARVMYHERVEGYEFANSSTRIHVVWAAGNEQLNIQIPKSLFIEARTRDGAVITPTDLGNAYFGLTVGFEPIYIIRLP